MLILLNNTAKFDRDHVDGTQWGYGNAASGEGFGGGITTLVLDPLGDGMGEASGAADPRPITFDEVVMSQLVCLHIP